jgi:hypothetical protein
MKMIFVIPGVLLLVVGLFFLYSPGTLGQVAGLAGAKTTTTVSSPPDKLIVVPYGNTSFLAVPIPPNDTISASFKLDPPGLNIFVMNQANFTLFMGKQAASPIESLLNASSPASLTLTNSMPSVNDTYYFVVQNNVATKQSSDVIAHYTITSQVPLGGVGQLPYIPIILGLALIIVGAFPKIERKPKTPPPLPVKKDQEVPKVPPVTQPLPAQVAQPAVPTVKKCAYCGAKMSANDIFCPSCKRAQQ